MFVAIFGVSETASRAYQMQGLTPEAVRQHLAYKAVRARLGYIDRPRLAAPPRPAPAPIIAIPPPPATVFPETMRRAGLSPLARMGRIQAIVADEFGVTVADMTRPDARGTRKKRFAEARMVAMYLARVVGGYSYPRIGAHFGNRDHSTVKHAADKISSMISRDDMIDRLAHAACVAMQQFPDFIGPRLLQKRLDGVSDQA
jgi:hypothetical protein